MNRKNAGENGEGSPTVGNFSTLKFVRPESATASMSFSETNSITSCPRFCSASATAMPGKRCPPVPPHAITAFIKPVDLASYPRGHSDLQRGTDLLRVEHALPVNV